MTRPEGVQTIYDNLGSQDKEPRRFDGYNYFAEHPKKMLEWFNAWVK